MGQQKKKPGDDMNATIRRAHEIRREAAARFGGLPGDYSLKIACEMAKNGEDVMKETTAEVTVYADGATKVILTVNASGVIAGKAELKRGTVTLDNARISGLELNANMINAEGKRIDVSSKISRDDLRKVIDSINNLKDCVIPGLDALRKARDTRSYEHERMMLSIDNGSSRCPKRTVTDEQVKALEAQYPAAVAYLRAESYACASNLDKYAAGRKAKELLISGGSVEQANEIMDNWLSAYCD